MNTTDRVVRIIAALIIGTLYYLEIIGGSIAAGLGILAVIFVITSYLSFCPLYTLVELSTKDENNPS